VFAATIAPIHFLTTNYPTIIVAFLIQRAFAGASCGINPGHASEHLSTEIRAAAAGFCHRASAIIGGFVPPVLTWFAVERHTGFAVPMLIGTVGGLVSFVIALFFSPKTRGQACR
jgi:SHS family lactate transporter-like MFS transporter